MKKKYIKQRDDNACVLIAFLNYCIERTGKSPIKYNSERFKKLFRSCGGSKYTGVTDCIPALNELNLHLINVPRYGSLKRFQNHLIKLLVKKEMITFSYYCGEGSHHMVLLTAYNDKRKLFTAINGGIKSSTKVCEFVTWEDLTRNLYPPQGNPDNLRYFNHNEGCTMMAADCIMCTRVITQNNYDN